MSKRTLLIAISAVVLIIAGCHKVFGGGWFIGLGGEKVTFGFQAQCIEDAVDDYWDIFYEGQFQYKDKANGVRFHGDINFTLQIAPDTCENNAWTLGEAWYADISGECRTQPGNEPGTFEVHVEDNGTPGPSAGDFISVQTYCTPGGEYYQNEGVLGGGNIMMAGH